LGLNSTKRVELFAFLISLVFASILLLSGLEFAAGFISGCLLMFLNYFIIKLFLIPVFRKGSGWKNLPALILINTKFALNYIIIYTVFRFFKGCVYSFITGMVSFTFFLAFGGLFVYFSNSVKDETK